MRFEHGAASLECLRTSKSGLPTQSGKTARLKSQMTRQTQIHIEGTALSASASYPKLFDYIASKAELVVPQVIPRSDEETPRLPNVVPRVEFFHIGVKEDFAENWMLTDSKCEYGRLDWLSKRKAWSESLGIQDVDQLTLVPQAC